MKGVLSLVAVLSCAYVLLCAWLYVFQRSFMYFPTPESADVPAEEVWVETADARLKVWRLHGGGASAIVYFGGNAEDVALNVPEFAAWFRGCAVYLVNYRGYGGSPGSPSEKTLYEDAEAVYDFARARHAAVTVVGRSLGSGVATHLASVREVERLVLITPFDSFVSLARAFYPFLPTSLLLKDRYDSASRAHLIRAPVLLLVAEHDEIVPPSSSRRLAAALDSGLLTYEVVEGTSHNTIGAAPAYAGALRDFACRAGGYGSGGHGDAA